MSLSQIMRRSTRLRGVGGEEGCDYNCWKLTATFVILALGFHSTHSSKLNYSVPLFCYALVCAAINIFIQLVRLTYSHSTRGCWVPKVCYRQTQMMPNQSRIPILYYNKQTAGVRPLFANTSGCHDEQLYPPVQVAPPKKTTDPYLTSLHYNQRLPILFWRKHDEPSFTAGNGQPNSS